MHFTPGSAKFVEKIRVVVGPVAGVACAPSPCVQAALHLLVTVAADMVVVDRGHRYSNGYSECSFYIKGRIALDPGAPAFVPASGTVVPFASGVAAAATEAVALDAQQQTKPAVRDVAMGAAVADRSPSTAAASGECVAPGCGSDADALVSDKMGDSASFAAGRQAGGGVEPTAVYDILEAGDLVLIEGLRGATRLNGRQGSVLEDSHRPDADGRVGVRVPGEAKPVRVKLDNLRRLGRDGDVHRGAMPLFGYPAAAAAAAAAASADAG